MNNPLGYDKGSKAVKETLKSIYTSPTEESGYKALELVEEKWGSRYGYTVVVKQFCNTIT